MNTISELKALDVTRRFEGENLYVSGYHTAGDGGGGVYRYSSSSEAVDDGGSVIAPLVGSGRYLAALTGFINVRRYGAVGDGVTDDRAAIQAAIDYGASNNLPIYLPSGRFNVATGLVLRDGTTIYGDGDLSVLTSSHNNNGKNSSWILRTPYVGVSNTWIDNVVLRNFMVEYESWTSYDDSAVFDTAIFIRHVNSPVIDGVTVRYCQGFSIIIQYCSNARVNNCNVEYSGRDAIGVWSSDGADVSHNRVFCCGDNGVVCHAADNAVAMGINQARGYTVSNNRLISTYGISCIGLHESVISNNQLLMSIQFGISVGYDSGAGLGANSKYGVVIANNSIIDTLNRTYMDGAAGNGSAIEIYGPALTGAPLYTDPPGYASDAGTIVPVYGNLQNTGSGVIAGNMFFTVTGNTVVRKTQAGATFSDACGVGYLGFSGNNMVLSDPTLTEEALGIVRGVSIISSLRKSIISANVFSGVQFGVFIFGATSGSIDDLVIDGNTFVDFSNGGGVWVGGGYGYMGIIVQNNLFDGDPYLRASNRNADGTWDNSIAYPAALVATESPISGLSFLNNRIKNVFAAESHSSNPYPVIRGNILLCQPVAVNYNAGNRGIGICPGSQCDAYIYQYVDSDPTSPTYGTTLNVCVTDSVITPPTTGFYMRGHFVKNIGTSPAGGMGSQYILLGWVKATTGTNNVAGVDWVECRALTGS